jgi:hypothetical protein
MLRAGDDEEERTAFTVVSVRETFSSPEKKDQDNN